MEYYIRKEIVSWMQKRIYRFWQRTITRPWRRFWHFFRDGSYLTLIQHVAGSLLKIDWMNESQNKDTRKPSLTTGKGTGNTMIYLLRMNHLPVMWSMKISDTQQPISISGFYPFKDYFANWWNLMKKQVQSTAQTIFLLNDLIWDH